MLLEIAQAIVADVKARHSEGDCPVTRQHSVENLEDALLTIASLSPAATSGSEAGGEAVGWIGDLTLQRLKNGQEGKIYPTNPCPTASWSMPVYLAKPSSPAVVREPMETQGPYEAWFCKDTPADCCDYGVVSLSERREVCRVWREQDARAIAAALSPSTSAAEPVAEPYAHEFGRSNGDGTFSVVIERGEPKRASDQWPIKPLYAHPAPAAVESAQGVKALEAGARAVLHRRIKPDFFEVKDGVWTLDHDKVIAEAAITSYLQALIPGSTGETDGWVLVPKERYRELVEEELWNAFNCGIERDGKWMDGGRSEGEWLVRRLGLPADDGWHDADVMKGMMAAAVDRAMLAAAGGRDE